MSVCLSGEADLLFQKWVKSTLVLAIEKNKKLVQNKPLSILLGPGVAAGCS